MDNNHQIIVPPGCPFSKRRWESLVLLSRGYSYEEIAQHMKVTVSTVRSQLHVVYAELEVKTAAQAVLAVYHAGWLDKIDTSWEDKRVTAAQHLYLTAFDRFLRARRLVEVIIARIHMVHHLRSMFIEAGLPMPPARKSKSKYSNPYRMLPQEVMPHANVPDNLVGILGGFLAPTS